MASVLAWIQTVGGVVKVSAAKVERVRGVDSGSLQQLDVGRGRSAVDQCPGQVDDHRAVQLSRPRPNRDPVPFDLPVGKSGSSRPGQDDHLVPARRPVCRDAPTKRSGPTSQHNLHCNRRYKCPCQRTCSELAHFLACMRRLERYLRSRTTSAPALTLVGGPLAQLVEQGTFNPKVPGSSPGRPTPRSQNAAPR